MKKKYLYAINLNMIARVLFIAILFLTACGQIKPTPENNTVASASVRDSVKDTIITDVPRSLPDSSNYKVATDTAIDCDKALHELINASSFDPEIKKIGFNIFVDTVNADSALLEITHTNEERGDDVPISWIKIDFNSKQLFDISGEDPVELKYDTILYQKLMKNCR
jgi:hypothetical protein